MDPLIRSLSIVKNRILMTGLLNSILEDKVNSLPELLKVGTGRGVILMAD